MPFDKKVHIEYIKTLNDRKDELSYWFTEQLRVSGVYWGVTALFILSDELPFPKEQIIDFVMSCYQPEVGGFGGNAGHDPHILYTLSAVQILFMYDALNVIDKDKRFINLSDVKSLQQENGSFAGDEWGEIDTRFSYCAISTLSILGSLESIDTDKAVEFILKCQNFDHSFGAIPGSESHAAQGSLKILKKLHLVNVDELAWWLSERQLKCGGLNGRPEKLEDVCYSWWVLSSLSMLGKVDWINKEKLIEFILSCQDLEKGGFSDRPNDMPDVFHTLFGLAGLSLLGYPDLNGVDPVYCMPSSMTANLIK
ncbi:Geranylgeranyl transferase type-2 subunit beta domain-containing protein [Rozella allomycis CSF55]|uniref:Geranylgeranyl transferase type-2 subunit beta n=1 Tax=Rozella allomycis (strain CSF55) TaxID=988480 RepID=A0A075B246_ROZAC|nr:Geranylgeranyl transferase type-2 subunit beta domain-containing protein [Rozella allomycis CSF55]|eukprot:EPZ36630.1 Geranylgeranyl transferase type-2 subunit beta domain-containing protein [Rozella allomycis CSF55]